MNLIRFPYHRLDGFFGGHSNCVAYRTSKKCSSLASPRVSAGNISHSYARLRVFRIGPGVPTDRSVPGISASPTGGGEHFIVNPMGLKGPVLTCFAVFQEWNEGLRECSEPHLPVLLQSRLDNCPKVPGTRFAPEFVHPFPSPAESRPKKEQMPPF